MVIFPLYQVIQELYDWNVAEVLGLIDLVTASEQLLFPVISVVRSGVSDY